VTLNALATEKGAMPIAENTNYDGYVDSVTWDQNKIMGCVCDSEWPVGLGSGETQVPEYFGRDCSKRRCPSADDPKTTIDETDCANTNTTDAIINAVAGNLCHVECSNNGKCDHTIGQCQCFPGHYGEACNFNSILAPDQTMM
jgi:hypothetical protein